MATLFTGLFFVGDPAYAINDDDAWDRFVALFDDNVDNGAASFLFEGVPIIAAETAGDGLYETSNPMLHSLAVDSGLIGLTPMSLAEQYGRPGLEDLGNICYLEGNVTIDDTAFTFEGNIPFTVLLDQ